LAWGQFFDADADAEGERLATGRHARMPQANKASLKQTLRADVEAVLSAPPHLRCSDISVAIASVWPM
jgi:hypothetical protein